MIRKILLLFFITSYSIVLSQEESNAISLDRKQHHQIGIGISKFINSVFPTDTNAFLIEYRYFSQSELTYRLAADYNIITSEDGSYDFGLKVGFDKSLKNIKRWGFYYGIDVWGRYLYYTKRKQYYNNVAINPFFGIIYKFDKNFSISTEPGFFIKYNWTKDNKTFDQNNSKYWLESRLAKIGSIQLNFHF